MRERVEREASNHAVCAQSCQAQELNKRAILELSLGGRPNRERQESAQGEGDLN